jgi:hypothetical protein
MCNNTCFCGVSCADEGQGSAKSSSTSSVKSSTRSMDIHVAPGDKSAVNAVTEGSAAAVDSAKISPPRRHMRRPSILAGVKCIMQGDARGVYNNEQQRLVRQAQRRQQFRMPTSLRCVSNEQTNTRI